MKRKRLFSPVLLGTAALTVVLSAQGAGISRFYPGARQPVICQGPNGTVLQASGAVRPVTLIIERRSGLRATLVLPNDLIQVSSIQSAVDNKAVITGMVSGSVSEVVIVNTRQDRLVDRFLAYDPALSPNGRFIAFTKFYPPHFVAGTSDFVLVYDLARAPAGNRPAGAAADDDTSVGTAVYPPGIQTQTRNSDLPADAINHVMPRCFWVPDSSRFAFASERTLPHDRTSPPMRNAVPVKTKLSLVLVDVAASGAPRVRVFPVAMCLTGGSCEQRLTDVAFSASGPQGQLQGFGSRAGQRRSLSVNYDQFRAPSWMLPPALFRGR